MAITRPNIVTDASARQKYVEGIMLLKNEFTGPTTASLGIPGPSRPINTYDLFVIWHHTAMMTMTPPHAGRSKCRPSRSRVLPLASLYAPAVGTQSAAGIE